MIGADVLFLTKISESEGFLELRELRSNGAIRRHYIEKNRRERLPMIPDCRGPFKKERQDNT